MPVMFPFGAMPVGMKDVREGVYGFPVGPVLTPDTVDAPRVWNHAVLLLKPQASTDKAKDLVRTLLESHGVMVLGEQTLTGEKIKTDRLAEKWLPPDVRPEEAEGRQ